MKAGRELDLLIAEKVMGLKIATVKGDLVSPDTVVAGVNDNPWRNHGIKPYSTDIAAAWEVVEKMVASDKLVFNLTTQKLDGMTEFICILRLCEKSGYLKGTADTAPHAICLTALKAKGEGHIDAIEDSLALNEIEELIVCSVDGKNNQTIYKHKCNHCGRFSPLEILLPEKSQIELPSRDIREL